MIAVTFPGGIAGLTLVVGLVFAASFGVVYLLAGTGVRRRGDRALARRMALTPPDGSAADSDARARVAGMHEPVVRAAEAIARLGGLGTRVDRRLERAGVPMTAGEYLAVSAAVALGATVLGWLIAPDPIAAVAIGLAAGGLIPHAVVAVKVAKRVRTLHDQLPGILSILASSLRAGHSFMQGLDMVAQEVGDPAAGEFGRVLAEVRLGRPMDEAMNAMADRVDSDDFRWAFLAVNVQREVGGNLAEILDTVAETVRERDTIRRQIKVLAAEGRMSITILAALPFFIAAWIARTNPGYLMLLVTTTTGLMMTAIAGGLMVLGIAWMRRIVRIDV